MKDSKQVRSEYQSFVESYSQISKKSSEEAKESEMKKKSKKKDDDDECTCEKVLVRKSGAFTELAEKYQMSVKQFARFVESNQGLFDVNTRKKAILANKFSGFKETVEWDEFFGDLELVEQPSFMVGGGNPSKTRKQQKINKAADRGVPNAASKASGPILPNLKLVNSYEVDGENLQEIQTKETSQGTKYKVRVRLKDSGSSYIRYATREKIAQLRADPKVASVEMTDEGEAPEDKGEKKAQQKGGGLAVKAKGEMEKKRSVTTEAMDPVGQEDDDIDNDGDVDKSDKYLHKRRKAIGKAMKKRMKEGYSDWRSDLTEVMDKVEPKKKKKELNRVIINPPMGEEFNADTVAESLGAEVVSCEEIDEEQLDEVLGGQPGDGYIGHPRLGIKNPLSKPKKKIQTAPKSTGLAGKLGNRASEMEKAMKSLRNSYEPEDEVLDEKALSKKQQKFMGMVYAAKKGEKPASPEVAKAAAGMSKKAARDFAKTKHKGLPQKKTVDEAMTSKPSLKDMSPSDRIRYLQQLDREQKKKQLRTAKANVDEQTNEYPKVVDFGGGAKLRVKSAEEEQRLKRKMADAVYPKSYWK